MRPNLKDEPKEWRKTALLTALGLVFISLILRWRGVFSDKIFFAVLVILAAVATSALFQPRWFRGYHLLSMRLGLAASRIIGYVALVLFFIFILTPIGLILRLLGKDMLELKPGPGATTYWHTSKGRSSLDRLF
jgi:hypothetical protein